MDSVTPSIQKWLSHHASAHNGDTWPPHWSTWQFHDMPSAGQSSEESAQIHFRKGSGNDQVQPILNISGQGLNYISYCNVSNNFWRSGPGILFWDAMLLLIKLKTLPQIVHGWFGQARQFWRWQFVTQILWTCAQVRLQKVTVMAGMESRTNGLGWTTQLHNLFGVHNVQCALRSGSSNGSNGERGRQTGAGPHNDSVPNS